MTEVQIDTSRLPPVQEVCRDFAVLEDGALAYSLQEQEIEQHYTSNIQKNQLVQKDIRIAKKLQDLEEEARRKHRLSEQQKELEDQDSEIARAIQEDIQREAEESFQRKEKDQEIAKQLQDLEEESLQQQQQQQLWLRSSSAAQQEGGEDDSLGPLNWAMAELELQNQQQLQQDEKLARELQAEELARLKARKNRERHSDYRAAQVAQDEEIARYMQDQELKAQWRSPRRSQAMAEARGKGTTIGVAAISSIPGQEKEAQESCGTPLPTGLWSSESSEVPSHRGQPDISLSLRPQLCRNIAEDLDPTFKAQRAEAPAGTVALCPRASAVPGGHSVPVGSFFDYPDELGEPAFVSPTKRQPEKLGRQKPRDKKEGCKQQ